MQFFPDQQNEDARATLLNSFFSALPEVACFGSSIAMRVSVFCEERLRNLFHAEQKIKAIALQHCMSGRRLPPTGPRDITNPGPEKAGRPIGWEGGFIVAHRSVRVEADLARFRYSCDRQLTDMSRPVIASLSSPNCGEIECSVPEAGRLYFRDLFRALTWHFDASVSWRLLTSVRYWDSQTRFLPGI